MPRLLPAQNHWRVLLTSIALAVQRRCHYALWNRTPALAAQWIERTQRMVKVTKKTSCCPLARPAVAAELAEAPTHSRHRSYMANGKH